MTIKNIILQISRRPLRTLLFVLLLTLVSTLLCLSAGLFLCSFQSMNYADSIFTTIVIPDSGKIRESVGLSEGYNENFIENKKNEATIYNNIYNMGNSSYAKLEEHLCFSGYSPDFATIASGSWDPLEYSGSDDMPYDESVFTVICESIDFIDITTYLKDVEEIAFYEFEFEVTLKVEEVVSLHPSYSVPKKIKASGKVITKEDEAPFISGKKYIVSGKFIDVGILDSLKYDNKGNVTGIVRYKDPNSIPQLFIDLYDHSSIYKSINVTVDGVKKEIMIPVDGTPKFFTELTGSLQTFLITEEGSYWKKLIEECEKTLHSVEINATGHLNSIFIFNQKKANIITGRDFSKDEYASGKRVCIISSGLAEFSGIELGDKIPIQFCSVKYAEFNKAIGVEYKQNPNFKNGIFDEGVYEIIGIYSIPEDLYGPYAFSSTAVFIPKNSLQNIPNADEKIADIFIHEPAYLKSIIIKNNSINAFKSEAEKQGLGNFILYYDQGWSHLGYAFEEIVNNSVKILILCAAAWIAVLILFLILYVAKQKKEIGIMRSLGTSRNNTIKHVLMGSFAIALTGTLLCSILGFILYDKAIDIVCETVLEQEKTNLTFSDLPDSDTTQAFNNTLGTEDKTEDRVNTMKDLFTIHKMPGVIFAVATFQLFIIMLLSWACTVLMTGKDVLRLLQDKG